MEENKTGKPLTPQQRAFAAEIAKGKTQTEVCQELGISTSTGSVWKKRKDIAQLILDEQEKINTQTQGLSPNGIVAEVTSEQIREFQRTRTQVILPEVAEQIQGGVTVAIATILQIARHGKYDRDRQARWRRKRPAPVTIIHVNQQTIRQNQKRENAAPVISVKRGQSNTYGHEVEIHGPCRVVYRRDNPKPCGARVWIETFFGVEVLTKNSE